LILERRRESSLSGSLFSLVALCGLKITVEMIAIFFKNFDKLINKSN